MANRIKIYKIINGYRVPHYVEINPVYNVLFRGSPSNLEFVVQGKTYRNGEYGAFPTGEYPYTVSSPDASYGTDSGTLVVTSSDTILEETLTQQKRTVTIIVTDSNGNPVSGAEVIGNSKAIGTTPASGSITTVLPVGTIIIEVKKLNYVSIPQSVNIPPGDSIIERGFIMTPVTATPTTGYLSVNSVPTGAAVYIDNTFSGLTPLTVQKSPGQYSIRVSMADYKDYVAPAVNVSLGSSTSVTAQLQKVNLAATITYTCNIPDALLQSMGISGAVRMPVTVTVSPGLNTYHITREGYDDFGGAVVAEAGRNITVHTDLKKTPPPPEGTPIGSTFCEGYDEYQLVADGNGGTRSVLFNKNAAKCGYPTPVENSVAIDNMSYVPALVTVSYRDSSGTLREVTKVVNPISVENQMGVKFPLPGVGLNEVRWTAVPQVSPNDYYYGKYNTTSGTFGTIEHPVHVAISLTEGKVRTGIYIAVLQVQEKNVSGALIGNSLTTSVTPGWSQGIFSVSPIVSPSSVSIRTVVGGMRWLSPSVGQTAFRGKYWASMFFTPSGPTIYDSSEAIIQNVDGQNTLSFELPSNCNPSTFVFGEAQVFSNDILGMSNGVHTASKTGPRQVDWKVKGALTPNGYDYSGLEIRFQIPFSYTEK